MSGGRWGVVLALLLTFAAQAWFSQRFAVDLEDEPDGKLYIVLAHNLLTHGVYSVDDTADPAPTYLRLPGYPWLLAGVFAVCGGENLAAVRFVQAALAALVCGGVGWLAFLWEPDATRKARAGWWAFGLAAVCPFTAIYTTVIQAEMLTLFLETAFLLAATWALRSRERPTLTWVAAGLLAGAMQLVRPESGLFAAAVGCTLLGGALFSRKGDGWGIRMRAAGGRGVIFSCAFVVAIAPWVWRNARLFQRYSPLPPANAAMPGEMDVRGFTDWYGTWADSEDSLEPYYWGMVDGEPATMDDLPDRAWDSAAERARTAALFARYNTLAEPGDPDGRPAGLTPELVAEFGRLAQERVARAPWRQRLLLPMRRAVNLWFSPHATYYDFNGPLFPLERTKSPFGARFWLLAFFGLLWVYTLAAFVGWWRLVRSPEARIWAWLAVLIVVPRWAYLATLENTEPRYMVELFPLVCVLGAFALGGRRVKTVS